MPMVGFFLKARTKPKPGINYILSLVFLVGWAPSNSKIHVLSQGASNDVMQHQQEHLAEGLGALGSVSSD